jgi:uncharacterized membrane protein YkgB
MSDVNRMLAPEPTDEAGGAPISVGAPPNARSLTALLRSLDTLIGRVSLPLLRACLGVVFVWFGALKLTPESPVGHLVAATVPFLPAHWFVPALGIFEIAVGVGLFIGRGLGVIVFFLICHLSGTFLVLVTQPDVAFQHGNPLALTMTGEFVVKNIVLMGAGLVLAALRHD